MDPKPRPNHRLHIDALRKMTTAQRAAKAFELSDWTKQIFRQGLRRLHPDLPDDEFHRLFLNELAKCHNRNY